MEPRLVDGQGLIAVRNDRAVVGELRCFEHPDRPDFWLVKRVAAADRTSMIVESDNRTIDTVDSNTFGPVDVAGSYRVLLSIPRRLM